MVCIPVSINSVPLLKEGKCGNKSTLSSCVSQNICLTKIPYLLDESETYGEQFVYSLLLICWLMWSHFFVSQWDFPERLHHTDTETCLPLSPQPGANVSDTYLPIIHHIQRWWEQLFIWTAAMCSAFHLSFTGLVSQLQSSTFNPWLPKRLMNSWLHPFVCLFVCLLKATDSSRCNYWYSLILISAPAVRCRISTVWGLLKKGPSLTCPDWNICKSVFIYYLLFIFIWSPL